MYCPAVHQYVQYIEIGVYLCINVLKFLNIHILSLCTLCTAPWADVHCALNVQCRLMCFVPSGCFVCVHCAGWCSFCAIFDVHLYIVCNFFVHLCAGDRWSSNFVISKKVKQVDVELIWFVLCSILCIYIFDVQLYNHCVPYFCASAGSSGVWDRRASVLDPPWASQGVCVFLSQPSVLNISQKCQIYGSVMSWARFLCSPLEH